MKIPKRVLTNVFLMTCGDGGCTQPGGMATDFNIWDMAMTDKELIDWTTCK